MKEIVYFWGEWCNFCKDMTPVIDSIQEEHPEIKVTKINVEDDQPTASYYYKLYNIDAVPATLGLVDGKLIDGHIGVASKFIILSLLG